MTQLSPVRTAKPTRQRRGTKRHPGWRSRCRRHVGRRLLDARRDERGSVELVVATPLLLVMILMVIQFAMFEHASQVAQATAAQALAATRTVDGSTATGETEGQAVMANIGRGVLDNPQIDVSRTQTTAAVTVHGTTEGIVPLWHLSVSATSSGPVERFASGQ